MTPIATTVPSLSNRIGFSILYQIISKAVLSQVPNMVEALKPPLTRLDATPDWKQAQSTDVNRFVGWALFSMRTKTRKGKWAQKIDEEEADDVLELLEDMSTRESEIVDNQEYLDKYYSLMDRIYNEGGLTLVSPKYAALGHKVLIAITEHVDFDEIKSKRDQYVKDARERVAKIVDDTLLPAFLDLSKDLALESNLSRTIFKKIVKKAFNARIGAFIRYYKSENIGRGTKGEQQSALREEIKHETGAKAAEKKRKRED